MAKKLRNVTRYIAYLDILGFRDMLRDDAFEEKISDIIEVLEERTGFDKTHHPYLSYLAVSDTIIITAQKTHAPDLLWQISQLQNELLKLGFCARGGIAFGSVLLYRNGAVQNIFGPTFVNAYTIESERAIYPRVVIEDSIVDDIGEEFTARQKKTKEIFVLQDADGAYFVNQFARDVINGARLGIVRKKALANRKVFLARIKENCEIADAKGKMKWRWLERQCRTQYASLVLPKPRLRLSA